MIVAQHKGESVKVGNEDMINASQIPISPTHGLGVRTVATGNKILKQLLALLGFIRKPLLVCELATKRVTTDAELPPETAVNANFAGCVYLSASKYVFD